MSSRKHRDIKAPDGYTLGGLRLVRSDGTILFNRGWWQAPKEWAGEKVWVHERERERGFLVYLEVAPPGLHIYAARLAKVSVDCERTDRPDAKPTYRSAYRKAWAERCKQLT